MSPDQPVPRGVAAVVLAAGLSRRFGRPKQLALLAGRTLLEHVIDRARSAGLAPVVAVVPAGFPRPATVGDSAVWVPNADPDRGMSHSLRLGLAAVPQHCDAAVVLLGDQPTVTPSSIRAVIAARGERPIVVAFADGHVGPPAVIERRAFPLAAELEGDAGLRQLAARHPGLLRRVPVERHPPDVDRPEDLDHITPEQP